MQTPFIPRIEFKLQRLGRDLTSAQLACATGVCRTSIERYESGTRDILSESFMKLLPALGYRIISDEEFQALTRKGLEGDENKPLRKTQKRTNESL